MSLSKRRRASIGLMALVSVLAALAPASAFGALGDQLGSFIPQAATGGSISEGRGIAISGSTAYLSSWAKNITKVDLASRATVGQVETEQPFGALSFDSTGALWGAEYNYAVGHIYKMDLAKQTINEAFDAYNGGERPQLERVDGLSVDSDETLWLKGEGLENRSTIIYHFSSTGTVLGECTVPFGNSGIVVEGEHLWLADMEDQPGGTYGDVIYEYDKTCKPTGVSFSTGTVNGEEIHPEGLALDHCTFAGHLALWAFGAATSSTLVAYDLGSYTGSTSDCPPPPKKEEAKSTPPPPPTKGVGPSQIGIAGNGGGTSGGSALAGGSVLLQAADPADPTGLQFVYIWVFGDGSQVTGHGHVSHTYKCAGVYDLTVTDIDAAGARHTTTGELAVGFPRSDTKSYRGLRFSPHVRVSGHKVALWIGWSGKGKHVSARSIDWKLDNQRGKRFGVNIHAIGKVTLGHDHFMTATAHFSNGHSTTIKACFRA